jgi:hypothetical protein
LKKEDEIAEISQVPTDEYPYATLAARRKLLRMQHLMNGIDGKGI